jgi:hypothetical protein
MEDALSCVKVLGKQYLWVDSFCIDQLNATHKLDQINRMWSIYRGAYVTLIALSGRSAGAGLPGLTPNRRVQSQMSCVIGEKRLVGLMPTLTQQIWMSPWGKRAWTLQEAILSPRCLYLSDHQLYFECSAFGNVGHIYPGAENRGYLFIEAIVLQFTPDYSKPRLASASTECMKSSI